MHIYLTIMSISECQLSCSMLFFNQIIASWKADIDLIMSVYFFDVIQTFTLSSSSFSGTQPDSKTSL